MEKECVWAWWYVSNNGYNLKGMRAKTNSRGVRQVIRGNSVVMLEVWVPEPALFLYTKDSSWPQKRNFLCYLSSLCTTTEANVGSLQALERIGGDRDRG